MWIQPICETTRELSANPHSDVESARNSDSEAIKDYVYDKTDYEHLSDNESITDLVEQLRQLEKENRPLSKTLDEK